MGGADRTALTDGAAPAVQEPLDAMGLGVRVLAVNLTDVQVPQAVLAAQRELVQAGVERERVAREAQGYAAELVPAAQGQAQRQRLDAQAYKLQVVGSGGRATRRDSTRSRPPTRAPRSDAHPAVHRDHGDRSWRAPRKSSSTARARGNTLVLPLDKLGDAGALKGAGGVTGVVSPAPQARPGRRRQRRRPPIPRNASGGGARDDRGRERGERQ